MLRYKNYIIYIGICFVLIISFFILNIYHIYDENIQYILDATVFWFDYRTYITSLLFNHSIFLQGTYVVKIVTHLPIAFVLRFFSILFGNAYGYILCFLMIVICAFYSFYKFLNKLCIYDWRIIACIMLFFFTSLTNFNYIENTLLFYIPYLIWFIILYNMILFVEKRNKIYLVNILLLSFWLINNITFFIIIVASVFVVTIIYATHFNYKNRLLCVLSQLLILFIPSIVLLLVSVLLNTYYIGDFTSAATSLWEHFYSLDANILNIFLQATDWWLFGSFNNEPYHFFSSYYWNYKVAFFGLLPRSAFLLLLFTTQWKKNYFIKH